jgi:hypothetical protein
MLVRHAQARRMAMVEKKKVSPETEFERFGEVKTYQELGMEQGNRLVPLSTLVALGWRMMPNSC